MRLYLLEAPESVQIAPLSHWVPSRVFKGMGAAIVSWWGGRRAAHGAPGFLFHAAFSRLTPSLAGRFLVVVLLPE
jgi:hypothetical protein